MDTKEDVKRGITGKNSFWSQADWPEERKRVDRKRIIN